MIVLYICFFIFGVVALSKRDVNYSTSLSPSLLLLVMMLLYSIFGSLYILDRTDSSEVYYKYWIVQFLGIIGVILSILTNKFSLRVPLARCLPNLKVKLFFFVLVIIHIYLYVNQYGGIGAILSTGYSLVFDSEETSLLTFSILGMLVAFSLKFKMHRQIFIASLTFFSIAILLGTRGIAVSFLSIPIMSYYLDNKRFSYRKVIYFIPLLLFLLIVAYVRNIGFSNIKILLTQDYDFYYTLFIRNSEFVTTGLVFYTGFSNPNWYENNFLEYIFGIIAAIIPKSLWPTRPDAISNLFSLKFAPPGEGIGFSIGYESFVILGYLGPIVYFYFLQTIIQKFYCSKKFYINVMVLFCPLLIMWINRIDLQTILKVSLIYLVYCYLWKFFIKIII